MAISAADKAYFDEAIRLYEQSPTGRKVGLGSTTATKLRELDKEDEFAFHPNAKKSDWGANWGTIRFGADITVHETFRGDAAATAMIVAHEAAHVAQARAHHDLESELACRELNDDLFQDLLAGFTYLDAAGATQTAKLSPADTTKPGTLWEYWQRAHNYRVKLQLVDFVLAEGQYAKESLTLGWIKMNLVKHGGIRNRWATTAGHFVRILGSERSPASTVIDLLEVANSLPNWNEIVRAAGGIEALRKIVNPLLYGMQNTARIQTLQLKWSVKLGAP